VQNERCVQCPQESHSAQLTIFKYWSLWRSGGDTILQTQQFSLSSGWLSSSELETTSLSTFLGGVDTTCGWCLGSSRGLRCAGGLPCLFICAKLIDVTIFCNDPTAWLWFEVGRFRSSRFVAVAVARAGWSFLIGHLYKKVVNGAPSCLHGHDLLHWAAVLNASLGNSFSREITSGQSG